jgi:hypothetical protein
MARRLENPPIPGGEAVTEKTMTDRERLAVIERWYNSLHKAPPLSTGYGYVGDLLPHARLAIEAAATPEDGEAAAQAIAEHMFPERKWPDDFDEYLLGKYREAGQNAITAAAIWRKAQEKEAAAAPNEVEAAARAFVATDSMRPGGYISWDRMSETTRQEIVENAHAALQAAANVTRKAHETKPADRLPVGMVDRVARKLSSGEDLTRIERMSIKSALGLIELDPEVPERMKEPLKAFYEYVDRRRQESGREKEAAEFQESVLDCYSNTPGRPHAPTETTSKSVENWFAEAAASAREPMPTESDTRGGAIGVVTELREILGCGAGPMLSELPSMLTEHIARLKAKVDAALDDFDSADARAERAEAQVVGLNAALRRAALDEGLSTEIIARLRARVDVLVGEESEAVAQLNSKLQAALAQVETLREALTNIARWGDHYPINIFPEPDFEQAHELLQAGGMTLDAISASVARRLAQIPVQTATSALAATEEPRDAE